MDIDSIKKTVLNLCKLSPEGFTYSLALGRMPRRGYVVATAETQDSYGKNGLYKVIKYCLRYKDYCIGGWKNEDGTLQFDASKVFDHAEEAIAFAKQNSQRAIYNLYTGKEIMADDYYKYVRVAS